MTTGIGETQCTKNTTNKTEFDENLLYLEVNFNRSNTP